MNNPQIRTRFAPSPTGFMHLGNLRTALFEFLVAKAKDGQFILRIEDTDQERKVEGAVEKIYQTLEAVSMDYDEGPLKPGDCGPYVQSERLNIYKPHAEALVEKGEAYYCFCSSERLQCLHDEQQKSGADFIGYDRCCREHSLEDAKKRIAAGETYVIRQKMPLEGETCYEDAVFGRICIENKTLEDQVLIKSDGFPTYNFANVVDDHAMRITHVVRGCEYLSSTPKYILLYNAFGYDVPTFVHLPLINGKDGKKLSKRHGATSFEDLVEAGYLPEAIINYLALLGWTPEGTQEIFSLEELIKAFKISGISKSPAVFDEDKLRWFNASYLQSMDLATFTKTLIPYYSKVFDTTQDFNAELLAKILQPRLQTLIEVPEKLLFLNRLPDYHSELFTHKKMKTNSENSLEVLEKLYPILECFEAWDYDYLHEKLLNLAKAFELKNGRILWPLRVAVTGMPVSPGGAIEALVLLGKNESLKRILFAIEKLKNDLQSSN